MQTTKFDTVEVRFSDWNGWRGARSQFKDLVDNDNMTDVDRERVRQDMVAWAQSKMNQPGFRQMAVQAMFQFQQRR